VSNRSERSVASLIERYGDGLDGSSPTAVQWARLLEGPADAPITLINLFKLRATVHDAEAGAAPAATGGEAMMRYAAVSGPALEKAGGRFLLTAPCEGSLMGDDEDWDMVAIGSYPSRDALFALFDDEDYREAFRDRMAAVERQRVLAVRG
jgi:uncharacterized protein (DUF1330 family)